MRTCYFLLVAALGMREESAAVGLMKMQQLGQEGDGGRVSQLLKLGKSLGEDFTLSLLTEVGCFPQGMGPLLCSSSGCLSQVNPSVPLFLVCWSVVVLFDLHTLAPLLLSHQKVCCTLCWLLLLIPAQQRPSRHRPVV